MWSDMDALDDFVLSQCLDLYEVDWASEETTTNDADFQLACDFLTQEDLADVQHMVDLPDPEMESADQPGDVKPEISTSQLESTCTVNQDKPAASAKRFASPVALQDIKVLQNAQKSKNTEKNTKWGSSVWEEWRINRQKVTGKCTCFI